jgi:hypothetical protein
MMLKKEAYFEDIYRAPILPLSHPPALSLRPPTPPTVERFFPCSIAPRDMGTNGFQQRQSLIAAGQGTMSHHLKCKERHTAKRGKQGASIASVGEKRGERKGWKRNGRGQRARGERTEAGQTSVTRRYFPYGTPLGTLLLLLRRLPLPSKCQALRPTPSTILTGNIFPPQPPHSRPRPPSPSLHLLATQPSLVLFLTCQVFPCGPLPRWVLVGEDTLKKRVLVSDSHRSRI